VKPDGVVVDVSHPVTVPFPSDLFAGVIDCVACFVKPASGLFCVPPDIPVGDPRTYLITPDDIGCLLKFKCVPMRVDGRCGHQNTSRPLGPVFPDAASLSAAPDPPRYTPSVSFRGTALSVDMRRSTASSTDLPPMETLAVSPASKR
jgi:hypothetical protein